MAGTEEDGQTQIESQNDEIDDKSEKLFKLPMSRVKHIMKLDPDVTLASQDAVLLLAKATELFIAHLAKESSQYTTQGKRKTIQKKDLDTAIDDVDQLAFLEGTLES